MELYVLGMIMGSFLLLTGKPQWIVKFVKREPNRKVRRPNNRQSSIRLPINRKGFNLGLANGK